MLTNAAEAMELVMRSESDDPEHVWGRLGIEVRVAARIAEMVADALDISREDALVAMETGALLVEAAREMSVL